VFCWRESKHRGRPRRAKEIAEIMALSAILAPVFLFARDGQLCEIRMNLYDSAVF
jgi:hypothetical protein